MKIPASTTRRSRLGFLFIAFCAGCFFAAPVACARTITLTLEFARQQYSVLDPNYPGQTYYTVFVIVSSDVPPVTSDEVDSAAPNPVFGGSETGYGYSFYNDVGSALNAMTNGLWTLTVNKGDASEKKYTFKVSASGLDATNFPPVQIITPGDGNTAVSTNATFSWSGPAFWDELDLVDRSQDYSFYTAESPLPSATTWNDAPLLLGTNVFEVTYQTNGAPWFTISTPLDNLSHPFTNWVGGSKLDDFVQAAFVTSTNPVIPGTGHTLVAHYTFDDADNLGADSSGNGLFYNSGSGSDGGSALPTNDAKAGGGAIDFSRNDSDPFSVAVQAWYPTTPPAILSALAGSFSVSVWVKTTNSIGNPGGFAYDGSAVIAADVGGHANDTVPIALTGGQVAFNTGGDEDDTLNSIGTVNDGSYHHIVVTREQTSGNKTIYIDGVLDSTGSGTTKLLDDPQSVAIGGIDDAGNPTFDASTLYGGFDGEMDDLQIYSGVLSPAEVANLFNNPGTAAPDVSAGGLVVHYTFDNGDNLGADTSGNGFNLDFNGGNGVTSSSDTQTGSGGAANFDGGSFFSYTSTPSAVLHALAGDFTLSLWIKTTQDDDNDGGEAWAGAGLVAADVPISTDDIVPAALDGLEVGINTGPDDDTLNSMTDVSDGTYHHIVVTRNQTTGEKQIYVDGVLDNSDFASTDLLNQPVLVAVGCAIDASQSNPADANPSQFYQGLMDDLQIYNRVVTRDEVAFLFNNPGATLTGSPITPTSYPVDVSFQLEIDRDQDPALGDIFLAFPSFISVSPPATTMNTVASPNGDFNASTSPSGGDSSSTIFSSLDQVLNAITNGSWMISINQGSPTQQVYSFQISVSGLNTNLLTAVKIFSPTNGAVNVALNPAFHWIGASNYSSLSVDTNEGSSVNLALAATNWPSAPVLNYGTNRFDVNYFSNNFPGLTFTTPVDNSLNPIRTWTTVVNLKVAAASVFVVGAPAPLPVHLINSQNGGGNFRFSFQTLAGRPHTIQVRTNLTTGAWLDLTNFVGDGSLKQFTFPATTPPVQFFRVLTQ